MKRKSKQGDRVGASGDAPVHNPRFSPPTLLAVSEPEQIDVEPKWVQIAVEGDWPGYRNGEQPFSMFKAVFQEIIDNLHRNPAYKADDDGVGCEDVIPWDFHHASELYPGDGSIPRAGAPAQGWTRELEIREGDDGRAQLWGLTRFLDLARGYIRAGQYKWASLAVTLNCIDPATNDNIGAVLTSIALTNQPVIQGMEQLVADRIAAGRWYDAAESAEEALSCLKDLFGLPEMSGAPEVVGELTKVQQWTTTGGAPLGVDVGDVIASMRKIFNLPALSNEAEVIAEAGKVINRLIEEQALDSNLPATSPPPATGVPMSSVQTATAAATKEKLDMELIKTLAGKLGVRESDAEIIAAVEDLVSLRTGAKKTLSAEKDTTDVLLAAAEDTVQREASGREKLTALVKALGVEDPDSAVDRVADLIGQSKQLTDAMPELENLRARVQENEDAAAETEVEEVLNSRGWDKSLKDALILERKADPEAFAKKYPAKPADQDTLLQSMVVGPNGVEIKPTPKVTASTPGGTPQNAIPINDGMINLALYPGRNITERAMSYVRASVEGADKWKHEDVFVAACELKKQPNVVDQVVG